MHESSSLPIPSLSTAAPNQGSSPSSNYKYWAFISYNRQDKVWATWLHKALENYVVPSRLRSQSTRDGLRPRQLRPIFRDEDETRGGGDLGKDLREALGQSRYLIVICTPRAAASRWVNEEIAFFKTLGRDDRVLPLIVDGDPTAIDHPGEGLVDAFPAALRVRVDAHGELTRERCEPLAIDVRTEGKPRALLKILAPMLELSFDELLRRHRRRLLLNLVASLALALSVCGVLAGIWLNRQRVIEEQKNDIRKRREIADEQSKDLLARRLLEAARATDNQYRPSEALYRKAVLTLESLELAWTLPGHQGLVDALRLLPPEPRRSLDWYDRATAMALSADGRRLAIAAGKEIVIRNLEPGYEGVEQRLNPDELALAPASTSLTFSADGRWLATACPPGVCIFDTRSWALTKLDAQLVGRPPELQFNSNGRRLAVFWPEYGAILFEVQGGRWKAARRLLRPGVQTMVFSRDENLLLFSSLRAVEIFDAQTGAVRSRYESRDGVAWPPLAADDELVRFQSAVSTPSSIVLHPVSGINRPSGPSAPPSFVAGQSVRGRRLILSPNARYLLEAPRVWDLADWDLAARGPRELMRFPEGTALLGVAGERSLVAALNQTLSQIDLDDAGVGTRIRHGAAVRAVAFGASGTRLATSDDGQVNLFELAGSAWTRRASTPFSGGRSRVAISLDGRLVAAWRGSTVLLWEPPKPPVIHELGQHGGVTDEQRQRQCCIISNVVFSPEGSRVAAAIDDRIEVLLVQAPDQHPVVPAFRAAQHGMGFSPDGKWLASQRIANCWGGRLSQASAIHVVDAQTGAVLGWQSNEKDDLSQPGCAGFAEGFDRSTLGRSGDIDGLAQAKSWIIDSHPLEYTAGRWRIETQPIRIVEPNSRQDLNLVERGLIEPSVAIDATGRWLAVAADQVVRIFALQEADLMAQVCRRLPFVPQKAQLSEYLGDSVDLYRPICQ